MTDSTEKFDKNGKEVFYGDVLISDECTSKFGYKGEKTQLVKNFIPTTGEGRLTTEYSNMPIVLEVKGRYLWSVEDDLCSCGYDYNAGDDYSDKEIIDIPYDSTFEVKITNTMEEAEEYRKTMPEFIVTNFAEMFSNLTFEAKGDWVITDGGPGE